MLLNEIFDTTEKSVQTNTKFKVRYQEPDDFAKNTGYYSHVVGDKDPHMVNKISHRNDPSYTYFVEYLIKNKTAQNNPHFPRIYDISKYTDENGSQKYKWQMERLKTTLYDYFTKTKDETSIERRELISETYLNESAKVEFDHISEKYKIDNGFVINYLLDILIKPRLVKHGAYRDALEITEEIYKSKRGLSKDLHGNNLMLRFGPYAPQIVIIDPFSSF